MKGTGTAKGTFPQIDTKRRGGYGSGRTKLDQFLIIAGFITDNRPAFENTGYLGMPDVSDILTTLMNLYLDFF
jgi:hypothetical protein